MKLEYTLQKQISSIEDPENPQRKKLEEKLESVEWLSRLIAPLNAGRFCNRNNPGARSNCTLIAEKCAKVLAGLEEPKRIPARKNNLDIIWQENEEGRVLSVEVIRKNQVDLVPIQEFIETIDLVSDQFKSTINLTQSFEKESVKYITSSRECIQSDLAGIAGSAISQGKDKTLTGIVYYYYGERAGHLANFFRDKHGHVFFVDAQSEEITESPPNQVLDYSIKDEVFFFPLPPQGGYFIKKEPGSIKKEKSAYAVTNHSNQNEKREYIQIDEEEIESDEPDEFENMEERRLFLLSSHRYNKIVDRKFILDSEKNMFYTQSDGENLYHDTARLNQKIMDFRFFGTFAFEASENNRIYLKSVRKNLGSEKCYYKWKNEIDQIKQKESKYGESTINNGDIDFNKVDELATMAKKIFIYPGRAHRGTGGKRPLKRSKT